MQHFHTGNYYRLVRRRRNRGAGGKLPSGFSVKRQLISLTHTSSFIHSVRFSCCSLIAFVSAAVVTAVEMVHSVHTGIVWSWQIEILTIMNSIIGAVIQSSVPKPLPLLSQ